MRLAKASGISTALLLLVATTTACNSDSPDLTDPMEGDEVAVRDDVFVPQGITVSPGATVSWTWEGGNPHNVTWDMADLPNSTTQVQGSHGVTMPTEPGEYGYHCTVHGAPGVGMSGTVTVQ